MFVGTTLTNVRILHGLTRKQLAEKLNVTEQAVWQYENGFVSPKMDVVNKLKMLFYVKSQFFYKEDILAKHRKNKIDSTHIAYRSSVINSVQKTQFESGHIEYLITFFDLISKKLHFPKSRLIELRNKVLKMLGDSENREETILKAAAYTRSFLDMDPYDNQNLLFVLEKNGAFVFEKLIGEKIDAYSLWAKNDNAYIMLGNLKKSAVRRNFDLAHELGHLLLHYKVEFSLLDKRSHRNYEHEANLFAGAFLLSEEEFIKDIKSISKVSHPDSYIDLKKKWMVSIQTMAFRAQYLELISYQQYRYLQIMLHRLKYKEIEPLDEELAIGKPGKVRSILQLLFKEKHFPLYELTDLLEVDVPFLTHLTGIEEEFFTVFQANQFKQFSLDHLECIVNEEKSPYL